MSSVYFSNSFQRAHQQILKQAPQRKHEKKQNTTSAWAAAQRCAEGAHIAKRVKWPHSSPDPENVLTHSSNTRIWQSSHPSTFKSTEPLFCEREPSLKPTSLWLQSYSFCSRWVSVNAVAPGIRGDALRELTPQEECLSETYTTERKTSATLALHFFNITYSILQAISWFFFPLNLLITFILLLDVHRQVSH